MKPFQMGFRQEYHILLSLRTRRVSLLALIGLSVGFITTDHAILLDWFRELGEGGVMVADHEEHLC